MTSAISDIALWPSTVRTQGWFSQWHILQFTLSSHSIFHISVSSLSLVNSTFCTSFSLVYFLAVLVIATLLEMLQSFLVIWMRSKLPILVIKIHANLISPNYATSPVVKPILEAILRSLQSFIKFHSYFKPLSLCSEHFPSDHSPSFSILQTQLFHETFLIQILDILSLLSVTNMFKL